MTAMANVQWSLSPTAGELVELDEAQCRELLLSTHVGRLAYATSDGPRVIPMSYVIVGDHLIFRTDAGNEAARCSRGHTVAFEVDRADETRHGGWSVLVVGLAEELSVDLLRGLDLGRTPNPYPRGMRSLFLHLPLTDVSGRLVVTAGS
jgi:hypothetical protein